MKKLSGMLVATATLTGLACAATQLVAGWESDSPQGSPPRAAPALEHPKQLKYVAPVYSAVSLALPAFTQIRIRCFLTTKGVMTKCGVEEGLTPEVEEAALQAVRQWRYRPLKVNGVPRSCWMSVQVSFAGNRPQSAE